MKDLLYQAAFLGTIPPSVLVRNLVRRRAQLPHMQPRHLARLAVMLASSTAIAPLQWTETLRLRETLAEVQVQDPVFIIGHWRSGTTHLHSLLGQTQGLGTLSMMQASFPGLFLSLGPLLRRFPLPETRPMDATRWTLESPQEEEIALSKLVPDAFFSQLLTPRSLMDQLRSAVLLELPAADLERWKSAYLKILKKATHAAGGRRLLLKNPANTGRLRVLLELFPKARFVYVHRNPHQVYPSMRRFYRSLFGLLALQNWKEQDLEELVLTGYELLIGRYLEERSLIPPGQLVEVHYDQLVQRPLDLLAHIFQTLDLGGFDTSRPDFEAYLSSVRGYVPDNSTLPPDVAARVDQRWGFAQPLVAEGSLAR